MKNYIGIDLYSTVLNQHFYTEFFKLHKVDAIYTALSSTVDTLHNNLAVSLENKDCNGIIIDRPFKQQVIQYINSVDQSSSIYNSCNSIVIKENKTYGFNSDLAGMIHVARHVGKKDDVTILGNGCMGKMFEKFLGMTESRNITVYSRSLGNWDQRHQESSVIINCTTVGDEGNSPLEQLPKDTIAVIDLATGPTKLKNQCAENNIKYINGKDFYKYQFMMQYKLLTGIAVNSSDYDKIAQGIEL